MQIIQDIMLRYQVDQATAEIILERLEMYVYIDFSECTMQQYNDALDEAFALEFGADALTAVYA